MSDNYLKAIRSNREHTEDYYRKSIVKTEQQKFLEQLLRERHATEPTEIADIACGGGTLSFHLSRMYSATKFSLVDLNEDAIEIARSINDLCGERFTFHVGDIHRLPFADDKFDAVFCWQTLSWIADAGRALSELIRVTKKGGRVYVSALFNLHHDVDLYTRVYDHTVEPEGNHYVEYNTFCEMTVKRWLDGLCSTYELVEFSPDIDFSHDGRGRGTYTMMCEGKRLQISAGMLLNWGVLIITK